MINQKSLAKTIGIVTLFSIAMGFLETAVVVYLREIYYPSGFDFPLKTISGNIAHTELLREAATVIMLASIGWLAGNTKTSRWAYFLLSFGVWDLMYYIGLKLILNWPLSLFSWDILFLIPVPWIGPVIAPCLVSAAMIYLAIIILNKEHRKLKQNFSSKSILTIITGCVIILCSFTKDYFNELKNQKHISEFSTEQKLMETFNNFIPQQFAWSIFMTGFLTMLSGIIIYHLKKE